jgi:hypothetical protein
MSAASHLDDPQYWQERADEIRTLAEGITDDKNRSALLEVVRDYQDFAQRALQRLAQRQQTAPPKTD